MWILYPLQASLLALTELKVGQNEMETSLQISMIHLEVQNPKDMFFI